MNRPGRGYGPQSPQGPYESQGSGDANIGYDGAAVGGLGRAQPQRQFQNDPYANSNEGRSYQSDQYSNDNRQFPPQQRQYTNESSRSLGPGRQYTDRSERSQYPSDNLQPQGPPRGPSRGPQPQRLASAPLNNNSGFDFGGGSGFTSPSSQYSTPLELDSAPSPRLPMQQQGYGNGGHGQSDRRRPSPPQESDYGGFGTPASAYASRSLTSVPQEPAYPGYRAYRPADGGGVGRGDGSDMGTRGGREPKAWDPVLR